MFGRALYYPWHDVRDSGWLKNAVLYWDSLSTLASPDVPTPYKSRDAKQLFDAGCLRPLPVDELMGELHQAARDFKAYTSSREWNAQFSKSELMELDSLSEPGFMCPDCGTSISAGRRKCPRCGYSIDPPFRGRRGDRRRRGDRSFKPPRGPWSSIASSSLNEYAYEGEVGWLEIADDELTRADWPKRSQVTGSEVLSRLEEANAWRSSNRMVSLFFTILATHVAEKKGLATVTDKPGLKPLADSIRHGWPASTPVTLEDASIPLPSRHPGTSPRKGIGEALLADYMVSALNIAPDTPAKTVIKFREQHRDELGRFRAALRELSTKLNDEYPSTEALQEAVRTLHQDEVQPAIGELRAAAKSTGVTNWLGTLEFTSFTLPVGVIGAVGVLGLANPIGIAVLLAGAGLSLTAQHVKYRLSKRSDLTKNPYSYIMSIERDLGRSGS
jgi:uncharacterized protein DUF6236